MPLNEKNKTTHNSEAHLGSQQCLDKNIPKSVLQMYLTIWFLFLRTVFLRRTEVQKFF